MMSDALKTATKLVVGLLVDGSYDIVVAMTRGRCLAVEDLRIAIEDHGQTVRLLPDQALDSLDVVLLEGEDPPLFYVVVNLWTEEEGRSDLALELRLTDLYSGAYDIEVLDLHVL